MMIMLDAILQAFLDVINSGVLWHVMLLFVVLIIVRGVYRIQRSAENDVDFFDLIRDAKERRLSRVGTFYMMGAISTTAVYIYSCTRPGATIADINLLTLTYGSLCIASQGLNKYAERPAAPKAPEGS